MNYVNCFFTKVMATYSWDEIRARLDVFEEQLCSLTGTEAEECYDSFKQLKEDMRNMHHSNNILSERVEELEREVAKLRKENIKLKAENKAVFLANEWIIHLSDRLAVWVWGKLPEGIPLRKDAPDSKNVLLLIRKVLKISDASLESEEVSILFDSYCKKSVEEKQKIRNRLSTVIKEGFDFERLKEFKEKRNEKGHPSVDGLTSQDILSLLRKSGMEESTIAIFNKICKTEKLLE